MYRQTIDFGIDLGTTNSSIAVLKGIDVEVFKNNEGFEYTPSAVWIDKKGKLYIGRRAKDRLEDDGENAFAEFKLQMGTDTEYLFARSGRKMKPEELSAEVLKALKADVKQRSGEDIQAAVITVPAAFELPQCDATKKAAQLAGLQMSPLLQEPVAAAMAYGFQTTSDKVFWLVYDFGGGTFDAAVLQVRDELIQVVNHGGDNHLGGKLIDWAIVEELLIPAVTREFKLSNFQRGNPKWRGALAKLKAKAEEAKIRCSRDASSEIVIDFLCQDDSGEAVKFEYELQKQDVERLSRPFFFRSVNICKKVLTEKRLGIGNIEKILLVGGPTLMPNLRELLADREEGLGIPLDFSEDPITVVARGAAIFASTQQLEGIALPARQAGQYAIQLQYRPIAADIEPLVGGKVMPLKEEDLSDYTIEFINAEAKPQWRSGKIGLSPDGAFMTTLWAEKGRPNVFLIELLDAKGNKQATMPDRMTYTVGISITDPPLTHSVGVGMANNETLFFFDKGAPLPARKREVFYTTIEIRKGREGDVINIPVVEGENIRRANRNRPIGTLQIQSHQIKRDIPLGSEIEVTIEIDRDRLVRTKAYIPILDEEYEEVIRLFKPQPNIAEVQKEYDQEKKRLEELRNKTEQTQDEKAQQVLQQIDNERTVHDVQTSLAASQVDRDAADKCQNRLLDLKTAIDEVEDALEWPGLLAQANDQLEQARKVVNDYGDKDDKQQFSLLEREVRAVINSETRDSDLLHQKIDEIDTLYYNILRAQPGWWVGNLQYLQENKDKMRNKSEADPLFAQGQRAMNNNDVDGLRSVVKQLWALMPAGEQQQGDLIASQIIKK